MKLLNHYGTRVVAAAILLAGTTFAYAQTIDVYKNPACGCCGKWVDHLRRNGFTPVVHELNDVDPVKKKYGVPEELASCHTAHVGGYVIEGHVPADLIRKLLKEHPKARGLAVPSMPPGAPGMEGSQKIDYAVLLIKEDGSTTTYAKR